MFICGFIYKVILMWFIAPCINSLNTTQQNRPKTQDSVIHIICGWDATFFDEMHTSALSMFSTTTPPLLLINARTMLCLKSVHFECNIFYKRRYQRKRGWRVKRKRSKRPENRVVSLTQSSFKQCVKTTRVK